MPFIGKKIKKYFLNFFAAVVLATGFFIFSAQAFAAWYDPSWMYRKKITITGQSGAGTNYQVRLRVGQSSGSSGYDFHLENHVKSDFGDLRFTASDQTTPLNYWVESVSGTTPNQTAIAWVKVPDDLGSNRDIYVYDGNASATSAANGSSTFLFFDDFSGDLSKWSIDAENTDAITISGGAMRHDPDSTQSKNIYFDSRVRTSNFQMSDGAVDYKVYLAGATNRKIHQFGWRVDGLSFGGGYAWRMQNSAADGGFFEFAGNAWTPNGASYGAVSSDTWYNVETRSIGQNMEGFVNGTSIGTLTDNTTAGPAYLTSHMHGISLGAGDYALVDDVRVRKIVATEPAYSTSTAEESGASGVAAQEFVSIIDPDNATGTDYTSLSAWEAAVQSDLTSPSTLVFSVATTSGTTVDGATTTGMTSGAVARVIHFASSSRQILLSVVSGTFLNGEVISTGVGTSTITATGTPAIAVAKCRSTAGTADTNAVTVDGWTTSATNYIKIWTDPTDPYGRHLGKWDDGKYRLVVNGVSITDNEGNILVDGLQIFSNGNISRDVIDVNVDNILSAYSNNIIRSNGGNYTSVSGIRIDGSTGYSGKANVVNNIFYDIKNIGNVNGVAVWLNSWGVSNIINNNVYGVNEAYYTSGGSVNHIIKNNIAQNCGALCYTGTFAASSSNNISSDNTAPGTNSKSSTTVKFLDAANYDFHLDPTDTAARDAGTSSVASAPFAQGGLGGFSSDIDGTPRGATYDIGADEVPVEYVSTICGSGATDCSVRPDYNSLATWEDKVEADLTATGTRVFSGTSTGALAENNSLDVYVSGADTGIDVVVVATTSAGQILVDGITGTSSILNVASGTQFRLSGGTTNMWTVLGSSTSDALGASAQVTARIDGTWVAAEAGNVSIGGWNTDNDNYILVYTTALARHGGKWDNNKYRLYNSFSANNNQLFNISESFVRIEGLQMSASNIGSAAYMTLLDIDSPDNYSAEIFVSRSIVRQETSTSGHTYGIFQRGSSFSVNKIYSNLVYGITQGTAESILTNYSDRSVNYIYNNTIYGCDSGINQAVTDASFIAKNNLISSTTNPFSGTFHASSTNNATDINDTPSGSTGTNYINQSFKFVSTASGTEDFHLVEGSAGINAGADLRTDPLSKGGEGDLMVDIDGGLRNPDQLGWDIGADEIPVKIYRSISPSHTSAITTGASNAVTISSTTRLATFTTALADNIGVGDVLIYNAGGTATATAFISGRSSSTVYTLQTASGTTPTAITGDTTWSLYRAYTSLSNAEAGIENTGIPTAVRNFDDWTAGGTAATNDVGRNLVSSTSNAQWNIAAYGNGVTTDTAATTISGWNTASQNYLKIYTPVNSVEVGVSQRHGGKWDDGKYRLEVNVNTLNGVIGISTPFTMIDGFQIKNVATGGFYGRGVSLYSSNGKLSNSILNYQGSGNTDIKGVDIQCNDFEVFNNIIYGFSNGVYEDNGSTGNNYIYNNTIVNATASGIRAKFGGYLVARNNITQNCANGYYEGGYFNSASDFNISDLTADAPGANSKNSTQVRFIDPANNDFHLHPQDTAAIDAGTSTRLSTGTSSVDDLSYDIDGHLRRSWDIGADEATKDFDTTVMETGGDFSTLASWEAANNVDLVATSTAMFACSVATGTIPVNSNIIGETSGSTGSSTVMSTTTNKILLYNIRASSTRSIGNEFIAGEKLYIRGGATTTNYCIISSIGDPANAVAKIDGAWANADTNAVTINGWTTGAYNYVKMYTTPTARHLGKWDDGKYRLERVGVDVNSRIIIVIEEFVRLDGLQMKITNNDYDNNSAIFVGDDQLIYDGAVYHISNNIIRAVGTTSGIDNIYAISANPSNSTWYVSNNIIYDFSLQDSKGIMQNRGNSVNYLYNNTFYNNYNSIDSGGFFTANNNIVQGGSSGYIGSFASSSNNISSDNTAPGTNSKSSTTVKFIDPTNYDFHLDPTDTAARNAGTSSVASAPFAQGGLGSFSSDIDGTPRGSAFDIGADELPAEYVSTICEAGATDCSVRADYNSLSTWEDKVEADLATNTTRVFTGTTTGQLNENDTVTLYENGTTTNITAAVVATTSVGQILVDGITVPSNGSSTNIVYIDGQKRLLYTASGSLWRKDGSNYFTVLGASTTDALGASAQVTARIDGSWGGAETSVLAVNGWTTDSDNHIKVQAVNVARCNNSANNYYIDAGGGNDILVYENFVRLDGLKIGTSTGAINIIGGSMDYGDSDVRITSSYLGRDNVFIKPKNGVAGRVYFYNNILGSSDQEASSNQIVYFYNNTILGLNITRDYNMAIYKNNIVYADDGFVGVGVYPGVTLNGYNNSLKENKLTDFTSCINCRQGQAFSFVSTSTDDYHLKDNDTGALNLGLDLSSDANWQGVKTDSDGAMRNPDGLGWDIGADEVPVKIYRSISPSNTTALTTGASNAITISSTTRLATFTTALADNIGVGDIIVYNTTGATSTAFISGRSSSTVYTLQTASGTAPTAITGDTTWSLYRAYTSLSNAEAGIENTGIPTAVRNFDDWTAGGTAATDDVGKNLVSSTSNAQWNIAAYGNGVMTDTAAVSVRDWTTGANNYIKIYTPTSVNEVGVSQRHSGKLDSNKYLLSAINLAYPYNGISIGVNYLTIDGLQMFYGHDTQSAIYGINTNGLIPVDLTISNNIIKGDLTKLYTNDAIYFGNSNSINSVSKIYNNVIYDTKNNGINDDSYKVGGVSGIDNVYNNTIYNCLGVGIRVRNGNNRPMLTKNNIVQSSTDGYSGTFDASSDYNISDLAADAPGVNSKNTTQVRFIDPTNKDFHLAQADTAARNAGANLTDGIPLTPFAERGLNYDVDGQMRNATGTGWDIGADEGTVEFTPTVMQSGGDYSSLSSWETGVQTDLVASTTRVFSISTSTGVIADNATVVGQTSHATGTVVHRSTSSMQILLENIQGAFLSGETVQVTAGNSVVLSDNGNPASAVAKIDGGWSVADTGSVNISGWITGVDNYVRVYTTSAARHPGKWDASKYRLEYTGNDTALRSSEAYTSIDGLQIKRITSGSYGNTMGIYTTDIMQKISNNIIDVVDNYTNSTKAIHNSGSPSFYWNNIMYGTNLDYGYYQAESYGYVYNNTVIGAAVAGYNSTWQLRMFVNNNIAQNSTDGFAASSNTFGVGSNYNISDLAADAPGANSKNSTIVTFIDATNKDFHLAQSDTAAKDSGASLFADPNLAFTDDIDGNLRSSAANPQGAEVWDIGADETPTQIYRSVGPGATSSLATDSSHVNTVTVASSTSLATFSAALADNIGVGDAVLIDTSNDNTITASDTILFIHARTDSTHYTLRTQTGALPADITANDTYQIYRAYTSLANAEAGTKNTSIPMNFTGGDRDLVANNEQWNIACYANGATADTAAATVDGWNTAATNFIKIFTPVNSVEVGTSQRHNGTASQGYMLSVAANYAHALSVIDSFTVINGLVFDRYNSLDDNAAAGLLAENITFSENIIKRIAGTHSLMSGVKITANAANIYNNIIYGVIGSGDGIGIYSTSFSASLALNIYNNTIYNCAGYGISILDNNPHLSNVKNNLVVGNGIDYSPYVSTGASWSNNVSGDATGNVGFRNTTATNEFFSIASGTEDLHLKSTAISKDAGTSSVSTLLTTDIDGASRNASINPYDIGADETATRIFRSISPSNTSALANDNSHANTVTVTNGTATFSVALADNIGVGDALLIDTNDDNAITASDTILFISGRSSSTVYTIRTQTGAIPADIAANDTYQIYRAYTSLSNAEAGTKNTSIPMNFTGGDRDLVGNNEEWNIAAYGNGVTTDTNAVVVDGWSTASQNYFKIYTPVNSGEVGVSQRHNGKWDDGKYMIEGFQVITISDNYVNLHGLQINTTGIGNWAVGVHISQAGFMGEVHDNIFKSSNIGSDNLGIWIESAHNFAVYNNIIHDFDYGLSLSSEGWNVNSIFAYNNTIYNSSVQGIVTSYGGSLIKNNIVQNSTDGYFGTFDASSDYNISDLVADAPGTNSKNSTVVDFIDPTNKDFHLAQSDTAARNAGANLTDGIPLTPFAERGLNYDVDGQMRNVTGTGWDIGADEGTVEFTPTVMQSGGDYSSLSSWETGVQTDLVASTTRVFSISTSTGVIADNATVVGQTSHATGTVVHRSTSSMQILLENIQGTFLSGETVQVTAGNSVVLADNGNPASAVAKIDGGWSVADTNEVAISGWNTGADNYITIYTTPTARHKGVYSLNAYTLSTGNSYNENGIELYNFYDVTIDGLQIKKNGGSNANGNYSVVITNRDSKTSSVSIKNNLIFNNGTTDIYGVDFWDVNYTPRAKTVKIFNNILYGLGTGIYKGRYGVPFDIYLSNNTIYGNTNGIVTTDSSTYGSYVYMNNNLSYNNVDNYNGTRFSTSTNNLSGPTQSDAPGANPQNAKTVQFVSTASGAEDFHLAEGDTAARNSGVDLSRTNPPSPLYQGGNATDIDGQSRFDTGWDIGADEAATPLYRSVGLHSEDLSGGGKTVTVTVGTSSSIATFSADLPANVGVGDAIQYGNPLSIAFISGRISSSTYYIQSATGSIPVATTTASAGVYRSHPYLNSWQTQTTATVNQSINAGLRSQVLVGRNLAASNTQMMVPCYASTTADNQGVVVNNWTTATTSYVEIYTPKNSNEVGINQRHNGGWDYSKYNISVIDNYPLDIRVAYANIVGIQMKNDSSGLTWPAGIAINSLMSLGVTNISNNIVVGGVMTGANQPRGILLSYTGHIVNAINNLVYGWKGGSGGGYGIYRANGTLNSYNNVIYDNYYGIRTNGVTINNVVFNNFDDFYSASGVIDYNASDDLDGTHAINLSPEADETVGWNRAFADYANGDFRIRNINSPLYDSGTSSLSWSGGEGCVSAGEAGCEVRYDIIDTPRPQHNAYDIGAFEFVNERSEFKFRGDFKMKGDIKFK